MLIASTCLCTAAHAQRLRNTQSDNPVYISDSPIASDALIRLPQLLTQSNIDEAVRLVHQTILNHGDRLIESPDFPDPTIYIPVHIRIHDFVLTQPELLKRYRLEYTPSASVWLENDDWLRVARDAWLTEPGMIASLHNAQVLIESGHFTAAYRALDRLRIHPDAHRLQHAKPAADLAHLAAKFINTDNAWMLADQWSTLSSTNQPPQIAEQLPARITNTPQPTSSLEWNTNKHSTTHRQLPLVGIVPGSLGQAQLTPQAQLNELQVQSTNRSSGANWIPTAWTAPVLWGDRVYTNDGITVSCFDRFTLRPYWRVQTSTETSELPQTPADRSRISRSLEDETTITIADGSLYLATGIPRNGLRTGDANLIKINASTGQIDWSVNIQSIDKSLINASIRGQIIVDGDTVIVGARTNNRKQRLISFSVVGLDSITGKTKWIRSVGSAGSLPYQQSGQLAHSPILSNGTIYWTEYIGLAFAIDSATGQVLWARSLPSPDLYDRFTRPSFANNTPVITDQGMFTLTTDGSQILQLDLQTGHTIASRPAEPAGEGLYLLRINDSIACVSKAMISFYPIERFNTAFISRTPTIGGASPIRGRVIVSNNTLLAPTDSGIDIIDPQRLNAEEHIDIDSTGNIIVADGQILVVNENTISSFLAWDIASEILAQRIESDPSSAITLAELAHRAGQSKDTVPLVLQALGVIKKAPFESREKLNNKLFAAIHEMIRSLKNTASTSAHLNNKDQRTLFNQLAILANTHKQVLAHRMAWGQWNQQHNEPVKAIRAYQDILDQPALGASMWEGTSIAVRGELEAARRIGELLTTLGYTPYRSFDQLARTELDFLDDKSDPVALEKLAQRFTWSTITPDIWLDASTSWQAQHKTQAAINAANTGIDSAIALTEFGINTNQSTIDQLAQVAISGMLETNQPQNAQSLASSIIKVFPRLSIIINGQTLTHDEIATRTQDANQLPLLGNSFIRDDQPLMVTGSPIKPSRRIDQGGIVLYAPQIGRLDYIRAGPNIFETIWSRKSKTNEEPMIPWQDQSRTIIFWPQGADTDDTGTLEAIETTTGRTIWTVTNLQTDLQSNSDRIPDDLARLDGQFSSPIDGPVRSNQLITVTDGHTIIVTDRVGRAIGIDIITGERLWNTNLPANRIHDIDLAGGILGICGELVVDVAIDQQEGITKSIVASIDPRTGKSIQVLDRFGQSPRWVSVSNAGNLFVATAERIISINTKAGGIDWVVNDDYMIDSSAGWIVNDQLIILNDDSELFMIALNSGTHTSRPLDDRQRIQPQGWVQAQSMIVADDSTNTLENAIMVSTSRGMLLYDHNQNLIGADPMDVNTDLIDVAWGANRAVYLQRPQAVEQSSIANLYLLDTTDTSLIDTTAIAIPVSADRMPISITAINGGVIVGYNEVSLFIRIPTLIQ